MTSGNIIQFDLYGKIHIGTVQGTKRLDAQNVDALDAAVSAFIEANPGAHLLLNLHHVEYVTSAVLSVMLHARNQLKKSGGGVRVCALHSYCRKVFEVMGLSEVFKAQDNVQEAAETYIASL
ncbi:MAG: anti-sigma factor antagonist [Nitrospiraceae bacterium]|nr:anti-sigma factor antagonist [Nitrospiraceae bacterium]